jgi:hypothetical protein
MPDLAPDQMKMIYSHRCGTFLAAGSKMVNVQSNMEQMIEGASVDDFGCGLRVGQCTLHNRTWIYWYRY